MRTALRTASIVVGLLLGTSDSSRAEEIDPETGLPGTETVLASDDRDAARFAGPFGGDYLPRLGARFHTPDGIGYVETGHHVRHHVELCCQVVEIGAYRVGLHGDLEFGGPSLDT